MRRKHRSEAWVDKPTKEDFSVRGRTVRNEIGDPSVIGPVPALRTVGVASEPGAVIAEIQSADMDIDERIREIVWKPGVEWSEADRDLVAGWIMNKGHYDRIVRLAHAAMIDGWRILDLAQTSVLVTITEGLDPAKSLRTYKPERYRGKGNPFLNWLTVSARRKARRLSVAEKKRFDREQRKALEDQGRREIVERQARSRLELAIFVGTYCDRLPKIYGTVLRLHYLNDLPVAEVAKRLDITESAAKVRLHRGRHMLRKRFGGPSAPEL